MDRDKFHRLFKCIGPAVLPVIHVKDEEQAIHNIKIATSEGAQGVFLINHDFEFVDLLPILVNVRKKYPNLWMGANFLGVAGDIAFTVLGKLATNDRCHIDAYWADNAWVDERVDLNEQEKGKKIEKCRKASGWDGLYFGGTAFKCQRRVPDDLLERAASYAVHFMDVVTTSGDATGISADVNKIIKIRNGCGDKAMAIASGITPSNASSYSLYADAFLVATGISKDFYNLDPTLLRELMSAARGNQHQVVRTDAWYLRLIAPNTKGEKFAWLDPTSLYINSKAFNDLTNDLICQMDCSTIDLVAGIDAMGFPLASAIAAKTGKGFLAIRKESKLCVDVDKVTYSCYAGSGKVMEMRKEAFDAGTKVLIVDQWMETGGTMKGAIELVEKQSGIVTGIATICVERNELTDELCSKYNVYNVIPKSIQHLFDTHKFV